MQMSLHDIASVLSAEMTGDDVRIDGVSINTRTLSPGNLFVGLNGSRARGSQFLPQATEAGAAAALLDESADGAIPTLVVNDTLSALQQLSVYWRNQFSPKVIAVTGSNGKTTMRSLIEACMGEHCLATTGNYNNHIGVPLMLLRLGDNHQSAVFELGANHAGEIAEMTSWVRPDISIITNAGPAHLEGFGSLDGVANAKGEIFASLNASGTAIINADDQYAPLWHELASPARTYTFGSGDHADFWFSDRRAAPGSQSFDLHTPAGQVNLTLKLDGEHNVMNACGAAAVAFAADVSLPQIAAGLAGVDAEPGRQRVCEGINGSKIFDDSYNANPASMRAAAEMLAAQTSPSWMVVGDMGELGEDSHELHRACGVAIREAGIERLFAFGEQSRSTANGFGKSAEHFEEIDALIAALKSVLHERVNLLVKGSRSMRMERVVDALTSGGLH